MAEVEQPEAELDNSDEQEPQPPIEVHAPEEGFLGNVTPTQQEKIEQFKEAVPLEGALDEPTYLRYLRARNWNVQASIDSLKATLEWRKKYGVDDVLNNPPPKYDIYKRCHSRAQHKFDKCGRPVVYSQFAQFLMSGIEKHISEDEFYHIWAYNMETLMDVCKKQSEKYGTHIETLTSIADINGLKASGKSALFLMKIASKIGEHHYPETLGNTVIINAPWIFPFFYNMFKPLMDPAVVKKIKVFKGDYEETLLSLIEESSLPKCYGGTCDCEGGCIPEPDFDATKAPSTLDEYTPDTVEQTIVHSKDQFETVLQTGPHGCAFSWYFKLLTGRADIEFSVEWHPCEADVEVIRKPTRHKSDDLPAVGTFVAETEGFCKFVWNNKYSKFRAKTLNYSITGSALGGDDIDEDGHIVDQEGHVVVEQTDEELKDNS